MEERRDASATSSGLQSQLQEDEPQTLQEKRLRSQITQEMPQDAHQTTQNSSYWTKTFINNIYNIQFKTSCDYII